MRQSGRQSGRQLAGRQLAGRQLGHFAALAAIAWATQAAAQDATSGATVPGTVPNTVSGDATATPPGADPQVQQGSDQADTSQLGDIVVTAQRRAENLQRVPIVITAVSGAQLAQAGVTSLPTLGTIAPGLNARTSAGGVFQPSIRGIGTSSNVVENPVALYIDGVYLPNQNDANRELPDVEQIAVLKGPQGTLFGRNATAGVIQITTRKPTQDFHVQAKTEIDNYATFRGGVFVTGGLTQGVAASVSADYATQGKGWGDNFTTGNDTFRLAHSLSLRGKLLVELGSKTTATLIGDYLDRKAYTYTFVPYPGTAFVRPLPGPEGKQDTYSPLDPYASYKGGGVSLTVEHEDELLKLVSITAYRLGSTSYLFDDVPTGTPIFYVGVGRGDQRNRSFTQELQAITMGSGPISFTGGLFYYWNRNGNEPVVRQFFPPFNAPASNTPARTTQTFGVERTQSIAPYGQLSIKLPRDTTLTIGGRYTYEKRELTGSVITSGAPAIAQFNPSALTISRPTWRIALDHRFTPDVLVYASYNRGIKSGGFNILTPANPAYLPEQLDAYEAGLKTELFDRRVRFNVGGFYYDYTNIQVTQFVGVTQTVTNGAKARLYGLDVDFDARVTPELRLSGGLELLHARFVSYPGAVGSIRRPGGGAILGTIDASGNRIPQAQKFAGTLALDYDTPVSFGRINANVTANHNGSYKFEPDNFLTQRPYTLLNASLGWSTEDKRYSVTLFGRNLLNEIVLNNGTTQAIGYPVSYGQAPRTFGATLRYQY